MYFYNTTGFPVQLDWKNGTYLILGWEHVDLPDQEGFAEFIEQNYPQIQVDYEMHLAVYPPPQE